jgi:O-antigen/teichoic acid export membrane protein
MMQTERKNLDRSLARAVAWNALARWISQILSWFATIVVARLLTPNDYGIMGMAGIYLSLAALMSQAGLSDAVISLRTLTRRQIAELNSIALLIGIGFALLSCAVAFPLARFFSTPDLSSVLTVSSVIFVILALQVIPRALLQKELRFKLLASIETVRSFAGALTTVIFAFLKFGYWSLVIGNIVSCVTLTVLTYFAKRHEFARPTLDDMEALRFTRNVWLSSFAWYVSENADFAVAGRILGSAPLGYYTVAWTISSAPIEKVGNLVTTVIPAYFSAVQTDQAELRRYLLRLTELLSLITTPASIGLALTAGYLVPALLGPNWQGAVGPLRILGLFVATRSVAVVLPKLLTAIGDTKFVMWITICTAVLMPIAFLIGGSKKGVNGIAAAWLITYPLILIPLYRRVFKKTGLRFAEYLYAFAPSLSASGAMAVAVLIARSLLPPNNRPVYSLVILVITGLIFYLSTLFLFYRRRVSDFVRMIRNTLQGGPRT